MLFDYICIGSLGVQFGGMLHGTLHTTWSFMCNVCDTDGRTVASLLSKMFRDIKLAVLKLCFRINHHSAWEEDNEMCLTKVQRAIL